MLSMRRTTRIGRQLVLALAGVLAMSVIATDGLVASASASPAHYFSGGLGNVARIASGERVPTIEWGTLSVTNLTTGGKVSCHDVIGGVVENPEPGGAAGPEGVSETQSSDSYGCEDEECPDRVIGIVGGGPASYISVFAEGTETPFPETGTGTMTAANPAAATPEEPLAASGANLRWKSHLLTEGTRVRQETEQVRLDVICHLQPCCAPEDLNAKGEPDFEQQFAEVLQGSYKPLTITRCCTPLSPPESSFDAASGTLGNEKGQKTKIEGSLKLVGYGGEEVINAKIG